MKKLIPLLSIFFSMILLAEEKTDEGSLAYVQAFGPVEMQERIPHAKGMTLWDVTEIAKPHNRLWWRKVNLKPEGSETLILFDFRRISDKLLEMKMKRIRLEPGDQVYFIEQVY